MRRSRLARAYTGARPVFAIPVLIALFVLIPVVLPGLITLIQNSGGFFALSPELAKRVLVAEGIPAGAVAGDLPESPGSAFNEKIVSLEDVKPVSTPAKTAAETTALASKVQEMTVRPVTASNYTSAAGVYIKNATGAAIDIEKLLNAPLAWSVKGSGPHVLIIHTHASEAYTPEAGSTYAASDTDRTQDIRYSVVRVGDEIEKALSDRGVKVIHDRNIYDVPYSGSYSRTLEAISKHMKENPSIKVIIDLHRDAIVDNAGVKYKVAADIGGKKAAQIMLVMGTGISGLPHPDWQENLKLALRLQKSMNDRYENLARPILMSKNRYNQHVTKGSMIVEIGTSGNSLTEAIYAGRLFADSLADVLEKAKG